MVLEGEKSLFCDFAYFRYLFQLFNTKNRVFKNIFLKKVKNKIN